MVSLLIGELRLYNNRLSGHVSVVVYKGVMPWSGAVVTVKQLPPAIGVERTHNDYGFLMEIQTPGASGMTTLCICSGSWPTRRPTSWCTNTCMRGSSLARLSKNSRIPTVRRFQKRFEPRLGCLFCFMQLGSTSGRSHPAVVCDQPVPQKFPIILYATSLHEHIEPQVHVVTAATHPSHSLSPCRKKNRNCPRLWPASPTRRCR
jgi:hypothetical protein